MKRNKPLSPENCTRLEDLPNIGKSIAADLRAVGIMQPAQLAAGNALVIFQRLVGVMGRRHDPCVLYTLLAAQDFLRGAAALPWWHYTEAGRRLLAQ